MRGIPHLLPLPRPGPRKARDHLAVMPLPLVPDTRSGPLLLHSTLALHDLLTLLRPNPQRDQTLSHVFARPVLYSDELLAVARSIVEDSTDLPHFETPLLIHRIRAEARSCALELQAAAPHVA